MARLARINNGLLYQLADQSKQLVDQTKYINKSVMLVNEVLHATNRILREIDRQPGVARGGLLHPLFVVGPPILEDSAVPDRPE